MVPPPTLSRRLRGRWLLLSSEGRMVTSSLVPGSEGNLETMSLFFGLQRRRILHREEGSAGSGPSPALEEVCSALAAGSGRPGASPSPEGHAEASPASEPLEACASRSVGAALLAVVLAVPSLWGRSGRGAAGLRTVLFLSVSFGGGRPPHGCGLEGGLRQPSGSVPAQRLHVSAGRRATCHMAPALPVAPRPEAVNLTRSQIKAAAQSAPAPWAKHRGSSAPDG